MPFQVVNTAQMKCSFGAAPSALIVLPANRVQCGYQPAANIMDHKPMVNINPFGMCSSLANPTVASATAAALGVLTPQPCIPATSAPWMVGAVTVPLANQPALSDNSQCICSYGGVISITNPGQQTTQLGAAAPSPAAMAAAAGAAAQANLDAMAAEAEAAAQAAAEAAAKYGPDSPEAQAANAEARKAADTSAAASG